jgi:hypothetical protein
MVSASVGAACITHSLRGRDNESRFAATLRLSSWPSRVMLKSDELGSSYCLGHGVHGVRNRGHHAGRRYSTGAAACPAARHCGRRADAIASGPRLFARLCADYRASCGRQRKGTTRARSGVCRSRTDPRTAVRNAGRSVYRGAVSFDVTEDLTGGAVVATWLRLKNNALELRETQNYPMYLEWFQWLVEQFEQRGRLQQTPAHTRHRDWAPARGR